MRYFLPISLITALCLGIIALSGCSEGAPAAGQTPPAPPEVTVSKPILREVTDYLEFPGETAPIGEVEIRARVTGHIVKVNFQDGQEVKKGDLLFEIDPRPYQAALDRAKGELARAHALRSKAQADVARAERLRPSGAISQDDYELAVSQLAVYEASIQSAEAAVRDAELNLEFTRVVSPIDGRVSRRLITEGNLVQSGQSNSTVLTKVVTTDPIHVYFQIEEPALLRYMDQDWRSGKEVMLSRIHELKVPVEIGLAHEAGFPHQGVLDFLDNAVQCQTGTLCARGVFENSRKYLTPGLYVRVRIPIGKPHEALLISERAIGRNLKEKFVFTVDENNMVRQRPVELGSLQDGLRVVESGIGPEDTVIVNGMQRARAGKPVAPHLEEHSAIAESSRAASHGEAGQAKPAGDARVATK